MITPTPRPYPDWHRMVPRRFREEVRQGTHWAFYYNVNWEMFLFYAMILHNKNYLPEGGAPPWFEDYLTEKALTPFDFGGEDIVLVMEKEKWVRNTLVFCLEDGVTPDGLRYNMVSVIEPSPEFLAGEPAPGVAACPQSTWEPYALRYIERLRDGSEWNPELPPHV